MTFNDYLLSQGKSSSTIKQTIWAVEGFLKWLKEDDTEVENTTSKEILAYLKHLQNKGISNSTRRLRLACLNLYFDYQLEQEKVFVHPSRHIKLKGVQRNMLHAVLQKDQLEQLYTSYVVPTDKDPNAGQNWFANYLLGKNRNKVIIGLMVYQGLGTGEITALQCSDLDLRAGTIAIQGGRKSAHRILELKSWQMLDLMEYQLQTREKILAHHVNPTNDFFLSLPSGMNTKVKENKLNIWEFLRNDIRKRHPYFTNFQQVRVSIIVSWLSMYNLREVQQMAGHKTVSTTERYLAYRTDDLQEDIDKFHPMG